MGTAMYRWPASTSLRVRYGWDGAALFRSWKRLTCLLLSCLTPTSGCPAFVCFRPSSHLVTVRGFTPSILPSTSRPSPNGVFLYFARQQARAPYRRAGPVAQPASWTRSMMNGTNDRPRRCSLRFTPTWFSTGDCDVAASESEAGAQPRLLLISFVVEYTLVTLFAARPVPG